VNPAAEAPRLAKAWGLQAGFIYEHALKGMSGLVPAGRSEDVAGRLAGEGVADLLACWAKPW
jgi:hypothetical protein